VDRSGAYVTRYVARQVVKEGLAKKAEVQVGYAIGVAQPVSVKVDTFGTGDERAAEAFVRRFDFRPAAIIEQLDLLRPIYRSTTNYGHFGKPYLPLGEVIPIPNWSSPLAVGLKPSAGGPTDLRSSGRVSAFADTSSFMLLRVGFYSYLVLHTDSRVVDPPYPIL
jgi:hypothetical protein